MGKRFVLCLVVALAGVVMLPAVAQADLVNEYGLHFEGQATCLACHDAAQAATVHGRFAKTGIVPDAPEGWTVFKAAGDPPQVAGVFPIDWVSGGEYAVDQPWITLGDWEGGAATEYLYWQGSTDPLVTPWNLVEGLVYETHEDTWMVGEDPERGLYDVVYACQRCHMLGSTWPTKDAADTATVPNPAATVPASPTTAKQWARTSGTSTADFGATPAVSYPGMGIQCENCHGTGVDGGIFRHGPAQLNMTMEVLGQSQVCGQCHGSYATTNNSLGIYGYTPNLPMRDFVDVNGVTTKVAGSCSGPDCHSVTDEAGEVVVAYPAGLAKNITYTTIPTETGFLAHPTWFYMFPNGSNAKGNHYYYDEWAASAHSYRGAYYNTDLATMSPDAMTFQASGGGHYNGTTQSNIDNKCYKCHTGEGYLYSKGAEIAEDFVPAADNVGFMGQECVTCHTPHPAAVGDEGNIRTPDAKGERSAAGLARGNDSVCEDCHNWQFEVQGTSPVYKPLASLSSRGGPSHPTRETVQGRVMVEVLPAGNFMPGVTCEDCHMPKTNKGATRFSHGMKIMMPGGLWDPDHPDESPQGAEEWNAAANEVGSGYMGEDSCSNCHAGETREELQANIDTWQKDTTAAADAAAAAIVAAQTLNPAEYSLTDSTKPGYVLIGKATWNYKSWVSDGSTGAHNPEYIIAGLEKAEQMAKSVGGSFAQLFASNSVVPGGTGFVTGKVVNGDGTPAGGAALELFEGDVMIADTVSADNGTFAFMVTPAGTATYSVHWARSSDVATHLMSAEVKVAVAKLASKTTIAASVKTLLLGKSVKLTGKVLPSAVGQPVKLQYRKSTSSTWRTFNLVLGSTSGYSKTFKPGSRGVWYFRTLYAGTATVASSKSAAVKVTVK